MKKTNRPSQVGVFASRSPAPGGRTPAGPAVPQTAEASKHIFVTSLGHPCTRFRRALERRKLWGAEDAAREMGKLSLEYTPVPKPSLETAQIAV
jgi:hypothetical protein